MVIELTVVDYFRLLSLNGSVGSAMQRFEFDKDGSIGFDLHCSCDYLFLISSFMVVCVCVCVNTWNQFSGFCMVANFILLSQSFYSLYFMNIMIGTMGIICHCQSFTCLVMLCTLTRV